MKPLEALSYITAADYLRERWHLENKITSDRTGQDDILPTETNLYTSIGIYANRLKTILVYPAILATRVTGVDAAVKAISQRRFNQKKP